MCIIELQGMVRCRFVFVSSIAFDFCVEYRRQAEFRKLGDMVRLHTTRIQSQPTAPNGINLTNSETQIWHFETRLRQLDCAMELEMYNVRPTFHTLLLITLSPSHADLTFFTFLFLSGSLQNC